jgi:NAD(P)-dependent dehydrogenase (short-subunit alcohol dehydrogenase family)
VSELDGRVVVVTGASRGIGKGLAIGLGQRGATVVCAARTKDALEATAAAAGPNALAVPCDIGSESDIERLIATTVEETGRIDALVNNAMTPTRAAFADSTVADWDESMRVNVRSLYVFARAVVPHMVRVGGGNVVNISSGGADHATQPFMPPGYLFYVVAKAAMERFSTALAPELAPQNIAVNALRPGAVKTEHTVAEFGDDYDWSSWKTPESVVPAVAALVSPSNRSFTGHVVDVSDFGTAWPD